MDQPQQPADREQKPHYQSVNDVVQVALERMRQEREAAAPEEPVRKP